MISLADIDTDKVSVGMQKKTLEAAYEDATNKFTRVELDEVAELVLEKYVVRRLGEDRILLSAIQGHVLSDYVINTFERLGCDFPNLEQQPYVVRPGDMHQKATSMNILAALLDDLENLPIYMGDKRYAEIVKFRLEIGK